MAMVNSNVVYGQCQCCSWSMAMLFMVNGYAVHGQWHVVHGQWQCCHGQWQCCSCSMAMLFMVQGNVVRGQCPNPLGYINL